MGLLPGDGADLSQNIAQRIADARPDIVDTRGRRGRGPQYGVGHVTNIDEVARHAAIAPDLDRLPPERSMQKHRQGAERPQGTLTLAVGIGDPAGLRIQAMQVAV